MWVRRVTGRMNVQVGGGVVRVSRSLTVIVEVGIVRGSGDDVAGLRLSLKKNPTGE